MSTTVKASQSELEAARRLFNLQRPGEDFEKACDEEAAFVNSLVKEVKKDLKTAGAEPDSPKSLMEKADDDPEGGAQRHGDDA